MIMQKFFFLALIFILTGCSCSRPHSVLKIGIDPKWYPIDFGAQNAYVNGFTEDLLLKLSDYTGIEFIRISANWDTLMNGLREKQYDAVFTSLPPYEYNLALYDFSNNFLGLGPVLILPEGAFATDIMKMNGSLIGILANDPAALILEKNPSLIIRNYNSVPDLLNGLVAGEIEGALLDWIPAVNYLSDLYAGKLKIASDPLTNAGLHLVTLKERHDLVANFNKNLNSLIKQKKLDPLLKKWQLTIQ